MLLPGCRLLVDRCKRIAYGSFMIKSFRSKALRQFAETGDASKLPVSGAAVERVADQLEALDAAADLKSLDVSGWRFHPLKGKPVRYSLRANANYRVTFGFEEPDAVDVDIEDYH